MKGCSYEVKSLKYLKTHNWTTDSCRFFRRLAV